MYISEELGNMVGDAYAAPQGRITVTATAAPAESAKPGQSATTTENGTYTVCLLYTSNRRMSYQAIKDLVGYALRTGLIEEYDRPWAVNELLKAMGTVSYTHLI